MHNGIIKKILFNCLTLSLKKKISKDFNMKRNPPKECKIKIWVSTCVNNPSQLKTGIAPKITHVPNEQAIKEVM